MLAAALWQLGVPAHSLRGGEAGVQALGEFGAATIERVSPERLRLLASRGIVPVVSGFQGVRPDGETVTLGRGGSDTTAVAIAAALNACCHIVTDVSAVHDRDPAVHPAARPLPHLTHAELLRIVAAGARVVHPSAALLALQARVPLHVYHYSAAFRASGTRVADAAPAVRLRVSHAAASPPAALRASSGGGAS
jgi:aspartate kinase